MKFTWGHGIVVALGCFMIFILSLVIFAGDMGEMMEDNYYEKTVNYQDDIDAAKRANNLEKQPQIILQANGIKFYFPDSVDEGQILLRRLENSEFDILEPIKLNSRNEQLIHSVNLIDGEYDVRLSWKKNQQDYLIKSQLKWTNPSSS